MAVTKNTYTGDGTTTTFSFSFPYLNRSHVKATINGTLTTAFTFATGSSITFTTAPANGAAIEIYRDTQDTPIIDFTAGTAIREFDIETAVLQSLYICQETVRLVGEADASAIAATAALALSTANTANTNATNAVNTANGIAGTANTALTNANAAVTTANAAAADVASATSAANAAAAAATAAQTTANGALQRSGGTMTGDIVFNGTQVYPRIPQNARTSAYTLVVGDAGKHISITTGGVTVPASVFSIGDVVTIYNDSASSQTITQGASVTLRQAGTANTGNRTLAQRGIATLLCQASNVFVLTGTGVT